MPHPTSEITDIQLAQLKKALLALYGNKLQTRNDCELLSEAIADKTGKLLSANTLRRVLGIIPTSSKPTLTTLDILSAYLGYKNYYEYHARMDPSAYSSSLSQKAVNDLYSNLGDSPAFYTSLGWAVQLAFRENNIDFLASLFTIEAFNRNTTTYTSLNFGKLLYNFGRDMQSHPALFDKLIKQYATNPVAQNLYFEFFVDYDLLPLRHHKAIVEYMQVKDTEEAQLFSYCLLFLRSFFICDRAGCESWIEKINATSNNGSIHPFPLGRKMACNLLFQHFFLGSIRPSYIEDVFFTEKSIPRSGDMNRNVPIFQMHLAEVLYWCRRYDEALQLINIALEDYRNSNSLAFNTFEKLKLYKAACLVKINANEIALSTLKMVNVENFDLNERNFNTMQFNFVAAEVYKYIDVARYLSFKRSAKLTASTHNFKVFESLYN